MKPSSLAALLLLSVATAACSDASAERGAQTIAVGYVAVAPTQVPITVSLGGRTVPFEISEVRPQVNGIVERRLFTEGTYVRAGQPLYQIDARLYRASVNQAEANLASARASASAATELANRYRPLAAQQAISAQELTNAEAQARVAQATIRQNAAALDTARINLRFATITAPISGRIGRSLFTTGALVTQNQTDPLAVIQRTDPIYVDIQQSSAELTTLRRSLQGGDLEAGSASVALKLEDGSAYGFRGTIQFSEATVDQATGTVTLRARFANPQGVLLPGMFVTAVFEQAVQPNAFLISQAALQRDFDGSAFVYVVGPNNQAKRKKVTATTTRGTDWVVTEGLVPGDKVITQGLANVKQDAKLKPVPASSAQTVAPRPEGEKGGGGGSGARRGG